MTLYLLSAVKFIWQGDTYANKTLNTFILLPVLKLQVWSANYTHFTDLSLKIICLLMYLGFKLL